MNSQTDTSYRGLWSFIAGLTAIITIVYMVLNVTEKVKAHTQAHVDLMAMRHRLSPFRSDLALTRDSP